MTYTIAKYLRISAEDIDLDGFDKYESNSVGNQRAFLDSFISSVPDFQGCTVIEEIDDGRTGTNFSRPGVQRLIEMAQSGQVQCIIVKDLSRWGRSYIEVGDFLEQKFPAWGVRFISVNDAYDSAKLNGATGGIDIAFRNLIYDLYSQDLSEKVRSAKKSMAQNGKITNAFAAYGYVKDPADKRKLVIDPPAAEVVRRIFDLAAQGITPNQIARILNDDSVPTAQERKIQLGQKRRWKNVETYFWYGTVVAQIVRDERYIGKLIYGKVRYPEVGKNIRVNVPESEWVVVPDAFEAIVTEEQFAAANAHISARDKTPHNNKKSKLMFSRKLKCGLCNMSMSAIHRKNDVKYKCYTGRLTDKFGCNTEDWLFEGDIAAVVLAALQQQMAHADEARSVLELRAEQLKPGIEKRRGEVKRLQGLIEKSKTTKMGLWEKYHNGSITAEAYHVESERIDAQVAKYNIRIPELQEEILALEMETGQENLFVERYAGRAAVTELTHKEVDEFVHEVRVYSPDRIEVIFNFADEFAKIAPLIENAGIRRKAK